MNPIDYDVKDLIPQRPPVVMIDKLIQADEKEGKGQLLVTESNLFYTEGHLSEAGITEFIAQTAAAYKGYQRISSALDIKRGYIAAVKNLVIHALPPVNSTIECRIIIENELMGYTIVGAVVKDNDHLIAEAEMRIIIES